MGKRNKKHNKPYKETISTYKEIEKYIKEDQDSKRKKFSFKQKKVKMPFKMYLGIKNSVLKKHKKEIEFNKNNDIIAQSGRTQKFMSKIILDKFEKQKELKKMRKLQISRNKRKSKLKDGTLTLSKNYNNEINKK
jgi:hypothetical protein